MRTDVAERQILLSRERSSDRELCRRAFALSIVAILGVVTLALAFAYHVDATATARAVHAVDSLAHPPKDNE